MNKPDKQFSSRHTSDRSQLNKNENHQNLFYNPWPIVKDWYRSHLGQELLAIEKNLLNEQLEQLFGYNLIQLGCLDAFSDSLINNSRISNQFIFESLTSVRQINHSCSLNTNLDELPVQSNSIDAVILPHTLEFEQNPHQILREVERILMAEGKVICFAFNPASLWGLWHKYWQIKIQINQQISAPLPSCGHLLSQKRLKDWLQLLGFDIEYIKGYFYRPPLQNSSLLKKLDFIEKSGDIFKLIPAGAYMMVATKRVSTLTPIRQSWGFSKTLVGSKVAQQQSSSGFKYGKDEKNDK
ncbi:MAG: class I SAM-dependent methyltransferase [gamma proteobacterium symbiont of Taylorina sp.]|nr:class I SAM-dependent methyltransferase [gamma proteobacterium symbiont of Taylorina sp.]